MTGSASIQTNLAPAGVLLTIMRILVLLPAALGLAVSSVAATEYLVAVPAATASDPTWSKVADSLAAKHGGQRVDWNGKPDELLPLLKEHRPRWLAVVGKPEAFDAAFVRALNRTSRKVDDDPWADVRWGLLTGPGAADVQRIVDTREPLVIERALSTTGIDFSLVKSGVTISDAGKGGWSEKRADGTTVQGQWQPKDEPAGTITRFTRAWDEGRPQLLVTSAHATQFNLEMPWGLGLIASHGGRFHVLGKDQLPEFAQFLSGTLFTGSPAKLGAWLDGIKPPALEAQPDVPKVWLACGNCLIADARRTSESMVVTALGSGGVRQFVGYVVPSWFGRAGWGTLGLWQSSRGLLPLADAFFLNQHKVIDETLRRFPKALEVEFDSDDIESGLRGDRKFVAGLERLAKQGVKPGNDLVGLVHDRDVVVLWGDPKWQAVFQPGKGAPWQVAWETGADGSLGLKVQATADHEGELALFLPQRVDRPQLAGAGGQDVLLADDFVIFRKLKATASRPLSFRITPGKQG